MKRLGIIAAMPGEVKYLVRGWKKQTIDGLSVWRSVQGNCEWVVTLAGAGQPAAARAFAAYLAGPEAKAVWVKYGFLPAR